MDPRLLVGISDSRVRVWRIDRTNPSTNRAWATYRHSGVGPPAKGKIDHSAFQNASYGAGVDNSPIGAVYLRLGHWRAGFVAWLARAEVGGNPAQTLVVEFLEKSCLPGPERIRT
jgi:hypothetical protein